VEKLSLHEALDIFAEHLPDVRTSLIESMSDELGKLEYFPTTRAAHSKWHIKTFGKKSTYDGDWDCLFDLLGNLNILNVEKLIEKRRVVVERITSRMQTRSIQQRAGQITQDDIEKARQYPIDQLYSGRLFGKENGRRFGHCPFHQEKTASFCIHENKGDGDRWSCFGTCNEHGDAIAYKMKTDGIDFIRAVKELNV